QAAIRAGATTKVKVNDTTFNIQNGQITAYSTGSLWKPLLLAGATALGGYGRGQAIGAGSAAGAAGGTGAAGTAGATSPVAADVALESTAGISGGAAGGTAAGAAAAGAAGPMIGGTPLADFVGPIQQTKSGGGMT